MSRETIHKWSSQEKQALATISNYYKRKCPLTLEKLKVPFGLYRNGSMIWFETHQLHDYIASRGDLRDPITRQPYYTHELMRLGRRCDSKKLVNTTLLQEKFDKEVTRSSLRDSFMNEIKTVIIHFLEYDHVDTNSAFDYFENIIFPLVIQIKENMLNVSIIDERTTFVNNLLYTTSTSEYMKKYPRTKMYINTSLVFLIH